jgi:long-chain acyl-CoA synthetase
MSGIAHYARVTPEAVALVSGTATQTFADLDHRCRLAAGALAAGGINPGDRVAIVAANRPEVIEVISGALRAGIVPVPVNPLLTEREREYLVEDSESRLVISDSPIGFPAEQVLTLGDAYERWLHEAEPASIAGPMLGRPMHYTSGTTGTPAGVWVPPRTEDAATAALESFRRTWGLRPDDVHLVCSPLAHSAPLRFVLRTIESGGTVVLQPKFDAAETLAAVELFGITTTFMVPTHLERIISLRRAAARHDLSTVRILAHAGAPIREPTKRAVIDLFPEGSVWEFYGATEGQATRISAHEWLRKPGSVGTAESGAEIVIRSGDGRELPAGETGEVWVKNPAVERFEYWRNRKKTSEAWRGDEFTVGDLGYLDDDGYLFLTGRKHDVIVSGGVNVYPREVEAVLAEHPAVTDVLVYGAPHDEWGEEVRAQVVKSPELPLDPDLLREWARKRLAGFKCPRRIEIVPELVRTATGKLERPSI